MLRYLIIIEHGERNLSAYALDLPGCVTTGATYDEVVAHMREAIGLHLQGMRDDGEAIPAPDSDPAFVAAPPPSDL